MNKTADQVVEELRALPGSRIKVAIADIDGVLRGKYLHKDKFLSAVTSGFGFCNVVFGWDVGDVTYDNSPYTGWQTGYPDALAQIDLTTYRHVPWDDNIPFFLGQFENEQGGPLEVCPRQTLGRILGRLSKLGLSPLLGMEFEWFNFRETAQSLEAKHFVRPEPITPGMFGYSLLRANQNREFFKALMEELLAFRVPIEGLHTETGPGVVEAAILYAEGMEAADRAVLFKHSAKEIGHRFGIMPSFMAKWSTEYPGCSGHIHQSLTDGSGNVFYDADDPLSMSGLFKSYVAGQIRFLPELMPMYAPTINSYKRLVDGYWAPVKPTWGVDNRTAALRVLRGSAKSTRLETRCPGSDVNPYLAMAACLGAGLRGIELGLTLDAPPVQGDNGGAENVERLPRSLDRATAIFRTSEAARDLFGDGFVDHFAATREWEHRQFQDAVTDWETRRYFEII
jgi:glutamine synthetase